ncbi:MAG TPA: TorF family putative porin, partial [Zoogloea sp.]
MRKTVLASALLASFVAAPAVSFAEDAAPAAPAFTSNVTLASEYIYRGIGQTNRKPAIQGGFDYAHSSGLYVGTWASN